MRLDGVHTFGAGLTRVRLDGCDLGDELHTYFSARESSFVGARLAVDGRFVDCDLRRADLRGSFLAGNDLRSSNLEGANLEGVSLVGCLDDLSAEAPLPDHVPRLTSLRGELPDLDIKLTGELYSSGSPPYLGAQLVSGERIRRLSFPSLAAGIARVRSWQLSALWREIEHHPSDTLEEARAFWSFVLQREAPAVAAAAPAGGPAAEARDDSAMIEMLLEDRDDDDRWRVYCDWLLEGGDLRGKLLTRLIEGNPVDDKAGGVQLAVDRRAELRWRRLFIDEVHVRYDAPKRMLKAICDHPASRLLRKVVFTGRPPNGAELLLQSTPVLGVRFAQGLERSLKKMTRPNPHTRCVSAEMGAEPMPMALLMRRFPALEYLSVGQHRPLEGITIDSLWVHPNPLHQQPAGPLKVRRLCISANTTGRGYDTAAMEQHALAVEGLEVLRLSWEPSAALKKAARARGLELDAPARHRTFPEYRWL